MLINFRRLAICLMALMLMLPDMSAFSATAQRGQVTFGGLPVPGVTVTATQSGKQLVAITDAQGSYEFPDIADGVWSIRVEMLGFATESREITVPSEATAAWELKLLPFEEITKGLPPAQVEADPTPTLPNAGNRNAPRTPAPTTSGFQRANVNATANAAPAAPPTNDTGATGAESSGDLNQRAATGLLVNGSVNNGAASPFAQVAAFGNNRRGSGWLYNGNVGVIFDTSAWDARAFSTTGLLGPKPSYNDTQVVAALGGPIGIPNHVLAGSNFFVGYQHAANDNAVVQWGRVPTSLERAGDLSQSLGSTGQPVRIIDPSTGLPFAGAAIPANRISPQAAALLALYPLPNTSSGQFNYQNSVLTRTDQDNMQARFNKYLGNKNQLFGSFAYQLATTESTNLFGFEDTTRTSGIDLAGNWSRRMSPAFFSHFKYEFSRAGTDVTPFFASRSNVSGAAGISGNDQDPVNWGPPNLTFSSGLAGLAQSEYARNANQVHAFGWDGLWYKRRHTVAFGADARYQQLNILSQQNARGTFGFTGAATQSSVNGVPLVSTGSDFADFLLGVPDTSSIAFGNADKNLRGWAYDAFVNDIFRLTSSFTLNIGLRWEYARPLTETQGRLVNLDIAPAFTAAAPVLASTTGTLTNQEYPSALLRSDALGLEPRVGIAWRPIPASPLIIRAGYGIYHSTSVYPLIATQLTQQPPFSKSFSVQNSLSTPLTLASGFNVAAPAISNTFAVDPDFHVAYVQTWNASVQEDLPGSLTMTATYLGAKGSRLMQEFLPNTFPIGVANPCPTCPSGFVYLTSNGTSLRNSAQIQVRRRLRNGITATAQYTLAKATDDASGFTGTAVTNATSSAGAGLTSLNGAAIAQNWLDLGAERSRSSFDQRHQFTMQMQYTIGEGLAGGALLNGWKGTLFKQWTFTSQLTVGSGFPLTPIYPVPVPGTGIVGVIRPNATGAPVNAPSDGGFLNPAAFAAPAAGQWGSAGRNSITGPSQFALDASIGRTFPMGTRLTGDLRIDATNTLNHVTYTNWNTTVGSPLFGLPSGANSMRKLQMTYRVRF